MSDERVVWMVEFQVGTGWKPLISTASVHRQTCEDRATYLNEEIPSSVHRAWPYVAKESAQ